MIINHFQSERLKVKLLKQHQKAFKSLHDRGVENPSDLKCLFIIKEKSNTRTSSVTLNTKHSIN